MPCVVMRSAGLLRRAGVLWLTTVVGLISMKKRSSASQRSIVQKNRFLKRDISNLPDDENVQASKQAFQSPFCDGIQHTRAILALVEMVLSMLDFDIRQGALSSCVQSHLQTLTSVVKGRIGWLQIKFCEDDRRPWRGPQGKGSEVTLREGEAIRPYL